MRSSRAVAAACLIVCLPGALAQAQQAVRDHPLVSRFQGSEVKEHKAVEFDAFQLPLGPIAAADVYGRTQPLEGKVTSFKYTVPAERSALEVSRSYRDELQKAGFQVLWSCAGTACFSPKFEGGYTTSTSGVWCRTCEQPMQYLAAKLARPSGDAYVSLVVEKDQYEGGAWLTIVEVKPLEGGLVKVDAAAMANDLSTSGHASIYGIFFDTGKATLKPESDATLAEIAKLLSSSAALRLHVVGHTDNVGTLASNMTLSKQRADAVVAALTGRYHVAPTRLQSAGVGPLAPVATNRTDEGRAKNRRVELVEE
ncbi:MAG TPA: OmpA family protein [Vicinamibacterales bacterium]|nr:OmpA family protein [Vicinamibacterales bacterium]